MISRAALADAQSYLREQGLDGWLIYDFQHGNPIFTQVVGGRRHTTRRCFILVPPVGEPTMLLHSIDSGRLADLGFPIRTYLSLSDLETELRELLTGCRVANGSPSVRVAMEYSPGCALPVVSRVDAGMIEWVRSLGAEVVSSADLLQYAVSRWTPAQLAGHRFAAEALGRAVLATFEHIGRRIAAAEPIDELAAVDYLRGLFAADGLGTEDGPVVAVGSHSGDPHYEPTPSTSVPIRRGDWVLIDLWAKQSEAESVYADMTWVGYVGSQVPTAQARVFEVVRGARDAALGLMTEAHRVDRRLEGWEVDKVARDYIAAAGFGDRFTHRLGHSLGTAVHSNGVNLDGFETRDTRQLVPGISVTVEPGIYLAEFGVRSEVDVYVGPNGPVVTTPIQREVVLIAAS